MAEVSARTGRDLHSNVTMDERSTCVGGESDKSACPPGVTSEGLNRQGDAAPPQRPHRNASLQGIDIRATALARLPRGHLLVTARTVGWGPPSSTLTGVPAESAHKLAAEAAQVAQRDQFAASIGPKLAAHDEAIIHSIESVEAAIAAFLAASGARESARVQLMGVASALGVQGDSRTETYAGVNLQSSKRGEAARLAAAAAPVFKVPGLPASNLDAIAHSPHHLHSK